jgi:urea carboxylase-associated protein 2
VCINTVALRRIDRGSPIMPPLDELPPEEYRRRYEALLEDARGRAAVRQRVMPGPIDSSAIVTREVIPGGWYWSAKLAQGQALRIVNTHGTHGVSALFWSADDLTERYSAADTMKVQWTTRLGAGLLLLTDMGRAGFSIIADSDEWHDPLLGGSTAGSNLGRYGHDGLRNTRDNLRLAAGKHGMGDRDISPAITFFAGVRVEEDGAFAWEPGSARAGAVIDLRAEMNVLVTLSNCPHPLSPAADYAPLPVEAIIWTPPPAAHDDPCRTASPESIRAFENTERPWS